ncbi:MAG: hybrid sensor histidine kinase/response regulator [Planctomycetes bacterium]|nr:hybrid sensor histidine kinase/response regulator [Planctomycetota bacterium]
MDLIKDRNKRILLVDDEPMILEELQQVLMPAEITDKELKELQGRLFGESTSPRAAKITYDVHCCRQGDEALEAVQQSLERNEPYAVAFLDIRMPPGPDGIWTAEQIRQIDPNLQIVMMTGYSDVDISEIAERVPPEDNLLYIQKPIHTQEIRQFALALTAKWQSDYLLSVQNQQLVEMNKKLVEHDRMKSEFVMTVSHELRTPLTIFKNILSNAIAGVMGKIPQKLQQNLEMADEAIDRLATIIDDFLDVSELEVGKMKVRRETLCLQEVIYDIVKMIRFVTEKKGIKLDMVLPINYLYIRADYEKIARVLNNLIENAVRYVPENTGIIVVRAEECDEQVVISVEDNGPGIHGNDKEKVFDKFVQVEKHVGPGKHGTGLGLSICRDLVHLHGGRIWVEDNTNDGTIFKILLPKYVPQENETGETEQAEQTLTI